MKETCCMTEQIKKTGPCCKSRIRND